MAKVLLGAVAAVALGVAALTGAGAPAQAQQGDQYICCYDGPSSYSYTSWGWYGELWLITIYSDGSYTAQCLDCVLPPGW